MKKPWKRVTAGVPAFAILAGAFPTNVEWGRLFGEGVIVASAESVCINDTVSVNTLSITDAVFLRCRIFPCARISAHRPCL